MTQQKKNASIHFSFFAIVLLAPTLKGAETRGGQSDSSLTYTNDLFKLEIDDFANRETCTLIAGASAMGAHILAYVVFKVHIVEEFLTTDFDRNFRFGRSLTGFSNSEITFDYLRHFNKYSFARSSTFQALNTTLEEWYSYNKVG
jgi:hypothetical protein